MIPMPEPAHTQVETYSGIAMNKVVETPLYTADQLRAYGDARAADERERCAAILLANAEACTGLTREILLANVVAIRKGE